MTMRGVAEAMAEAPAGAVWSKTCQVLKRELGEATFGSWLGQAALRESGDEVYLVAATGVARDWIRRHAWRRIGELWAQHDPLGRRLHGVAWKLAHRLPPLHRPLDLAVELKWNHFNGRKLLQLGLIDWRLAG